MAGSVTRAGIGLLEAVDTGRVSASRIVAGKRTNGAVLPIADAGAGAAARAGRSIADWIPADRQAGALVADHIARFTLAGARGVAAHTVDAEEVFAFPGTAARRARYASGGGAATPWGRHAYEPAEHTLDDGAAGETPRH